MERKGELFTIRLTKEEGTRIRQYLKSNQVFQGFSGFARTALMEFMKGQTALRLQPLASSPGAGRPTFLWDYDLTEAEVRALLRKGPDLKTDWLVARLLERGRWDDIWSYLSLAHVAAVLERLKMTEKVKSHWRFALARWSQG